MKRYLLAAAMILASSAQAESMYFGALNKSKTLNEFCFYKISVLQLLADSKAKTEVQQAVKALNQRNANYAQKIQDEYEASWKEEGACKEFSSSNTIDVKSRLANSLGATLASVFNQAYMYSGGAHGGTTISVDNFNTETGEIYTHLGVFFDQSKLPTILNYIEKSILEERKNFDVNFGWSDWKKSKTSLNQITNFYVSDNGLVIYFQQYEIASYAEGIIEVTIPWYELDQIGLKASSASQALISSKPY